MSIPSGFNRAKFVALCRRVAYEWVDGSIEAEEAMRLIADAAPRRYKTREDLLLEVNVENPIWDTGDVATYCEQTTDVVRALARDGLFLDARVRKHPRYIPAQVVAAWTGHLAELRRAYA